VVTSSNRANKPLAFPASASGRAVMATAIRSSSFKEAPQETDAGGNIFQALVAHILLDGQPAAIPDLLQHAQIGHPVEVAVPERDRLSA
jgi:hypothetical protein